MQTLCFGGMRLGGLGGIEDRAGRADCGSGTKGRACTPKCAGESGWEVLQASQRRPGFSFCISGILCMCCLLGPWPSPGGGWGLLYRTQGSWEPRFHPGAVASRLMFEQLVLRQVGAVFAGTTHLSCRTLARLGSAGGAPGRCCGGARAWVPGGPAPVLRGSQSRFPAGAL